MPLSCKTGRCRVLLTVCPVSLIPGHHESILWPLHQRRRSLYGLKPRLALLTLALKRVKHLLTSSIERRVRIIWRLESAISIVQRVEHHSFLKQQFFHSFGFSHGPPAYVITGVENGSLMVLLTLTQNHTLFFKLSLIISEIYSDLLKSLVFMQVCHFAFL